MQLYCTKGKIEVNFFDLEAEPLNSAHCGLKINEQERLKEFVDIEWASTSSAGAPEARNVNIGPNGNILQSMSVCCDTGKKFISAGYMDGIVRIYPFPAVDSSECLNINIHVDGPVLTAFTASKELESENSSFDWFHKDKNGPKKDNKRRLVTVGVYDGAILVWNLQGLQ